MVVELLTISYILLTNKKKGRGYRKKKKESSGKRRRKRRGWRRREKLGKKGEKGNSFNLDRNNCLKKIR